jgi:hypothetical protein
MEKLDIDALLEKNPHLDAEKAKLKEHGARKESGRTKKGAARVPFGKRRDIGEEAWNTTDPSARPHYRAG